MNTHRNNTRLARFARWIVLWSWSAPLLLAGGTVIVLAESETISEGRPVLLPRPLVLWLLGLIKWVGDHLNNNAGIVWLMLGIWIAFLATTAWSVRRRPSQPVV